MTENTIATPKMLRNVKDAIEIIYENNHLSIVEKRLIG